MRETSWCCGFPLCQRRRDGWTRDFVLIGDGWNKDGDYNTAFSKTVLPLPSHQQPNYDAEPELLEDDPVYRFHPEDWREYHTRYVTPRISSAAEAQGRRLARFGSGVNP